MAEEAAEAAPKKKSKMGLMLIVLIVLVLGGGGAGAFFFMKSKGDTSKEASAGKEVGGATHAKKGEDGKEAEPGVLSLESFIANLADPEGDRYLKCTLRLEIDHRESAEAIKANDLVITKIRDRILTLLTSKTFAQIASADGKDTLREEIRKQLDPLLLGGHIEGVYYSEFIVQ